MNSFRVIDHPLVDQNDGFEESVNDFSDLLASNPEFYSELAQDPEQFVAEQVRMPFYSRIELELSKNMRNTGTSVAG